MTTRMPHGSMRRDPCHLMQRTECSENQAKIGWLGWSSYEGDKTPATQKSPPLKWGLLLGRNGTRRREMGPFGQMSSRISTPQFPLNPWVWPVARDPC